jgi:hypothetical protein
LIHGQEIGEKPLHPAPLNWPDQISECSRY